MKFSVVLPTYNRGEMLVRAVDSMLAQSYPDFELIIVDDGSTDDTSQLMKKYLDSRIKYFWKKNEERSIARNYGIRQASGEYICFLDADDYFLPNHLQQGRMEIERLTYPEVFHLAYEMRQNDGVVRQPDQFPDIINDELAFENRLSCNGMFIRSDVAKQFGFLNSSEAVISEDWYLWLRLAARFPIHCSNVVTSVITDHDLRSLYSTKSGKVERSLNLIVEALSQDKAVTEYYASRFGYFKSECFSLVALALSEDSTKKHKSLVYLLKAIRNYPSFLFRRRFLAIVRNVILR